MTSSATDLLAELPRLRRYARILAGDCEAADRLVEEALLRFRRRSNESASPSARSLELLSLLRDVAAEAARPGEPPKLSGAMFSRPAKRLSGPAPSAGSLSDRAGDMIAQVGELPLAQREVLLLVAVERLSYDDIAGLLRIPAATVISRLSEAREALHAAALKVRPAPNNVR